MSLPGLGLALVAPRQLGLQLVELALELGVRPVDGDEPVGRLDLAPDLVAAAGDRDLAHLAVGDAWVLLLGEVDLGVLEPVDVAPEPPDLLLGDESEAVGDLGVPAADGHIHRQDLPVDSRDRMVDRPRTALDARTGSSGRRTGAAPPPSRMGGGKAEHAGGTGDVGGPVRRRRRWRRW